jgi:hypothetical protein
MFREDLAARRPQQHSHDGDDLPKAGLAVIVHGADIMDRIFPTGTDRVVSTALTTGPLSSRSQVAVRAGSISARLTWERPPVSVRWWAQRVALITDATTR